MHPPSPYNQICPYPAISYGSKVYLSKRKEDGSFLVIKQIPVDEMGVDERKASQTEVDVLAMLKAPEYHRLLRQFYAGQIHDDCHGVRTRYAAGNGSCRDCLFRHGRSATFNLTSKINHIIIVPQLP